MQSFFCIPQGCISDYQFVSKRYINFVQLNSSSTSWALSSGMYSRFAALKAPSKIAWLTFSRCSGVRFLPKDVDRLLRVAFFHIYPPGLS